MNSFRWWQRTILPKMQTIPFGKKPVKCSNFTSKRLALLSLLNQSLLRQNMRLVAPFIVSISAVGNLLTLQNRSRVLPDLIPSRHRLPAMHTYTLSYVRVWKSLIELVTCLKDLPSEVVSAYF